MSLPIRSSRSAAGGLFRLLLLRCTLFDHHRCHFLSRCPFCRLMSLLIALTATHHVGDAHCLLRPFGSTCPVHALDALAKFACCRGIQSSRKSSADSIYLQTRTHERIAPLGTVAEKDPYEKNARCQRPFSALFFRSWRAKSQGAEFHRSWVSDSTVACYLYFDDLINDCVHE